MRFRTKLMVIIATIMSLLIVPVFSGAVFASPATDACEGVKAAGGDCDTTAGTTGFKDIIGSIISVLSIVVGAVSVIMIIIGGFRYVISAGDSNGISGAKNTILYALVGLVIVLFAQVIVRFVITSVDTKPASSATPGTGTPGTGTPGTGTPGTGTPGTGTPGTGGI